MKKKTFYILLAVWIVALATFVGVLISSLTNDKDDGSGLPTPPTTQQGGGGNTDGGNNDGGNNGGGNNDGGDNGGAESGDNDLVYGDDGYDWIHG